jgi:hypothetical protein
MPPVERPSDMRGFLVLLVALLVTACAGGASPTPSASPPSAVDPEVATVNVTCGGPAFPTSVLSEAGTAETDPGPEADALRALLQRPEATDLLPPTGWRLAVHTGDMVVYIADVPARADEPAFADVTLELVDGAWRMRGFGQCRPVADVGPGLGLAEFRVAGHERLTPETTELDVLVTERACNSGQDARGRIVEPAIIPGADAITVVFGVVPRGGVHSCPSNPETPARLVLPEPLGDRMLLDGSSVPPRDATACPDIGVCP